METITINKEQFNKLYSLACKTWKDVLLDKCKLLLTQEAVEVDIYEVYEALESANADQKVSIREILELNQLYTKLKMEVGKWYEEESHKCLFQYLGNERVLGQFRVNHGFYTWTWTNNQENNLREVDPDEVVILLNRRFSI